VLTARARVCVGTCAPQIRLRLLFPAADVGRMISRRPMLLLDDQFDQV
jgi:hypothetical protein